MENNNRKSYKDEDIKGSSLEVAIRTLAYPFDTVQEKVDIINDKFANNFFISDKKLSQEEKIIYYKKYFTCYYSYEKVIYNSYGLTIEEPF